MKLILIAIIFFVGSCLFAVQPTTAAATATPKKISYKEAKEMCLKTDANLKGKELRSCIHDKRKLASNK